MSKKARFQEAIATSLQSLQRSGAKITKQKVIDRAQFEDGTPVGKTTLYSRHETTKEFVHADLLSMIDDAIDAQRKSGGKRTKTDTVLSLKKEIATLKKQYQALVDQTVEQEARLKASKSDSHGDKHIVLALEQDVFVLASIVSTLSNGAIKDFQDIADKYEQKYRSKPQLKVAQEEISRYIEDIKRSRLVTLNEPKLR